MPLSAERSAISVLGASWLSDSSLLLAGIDTRGQMAAATLVDGGWRVPVRWRSTFYSAPAHRWIAVVHADEPVRGKPEMRLEIGLRVERQAVDAGRVADIATDLRTLARAHLTALGPAERRAIVEFLAASTADAGANRTEQVRLSRSLHLLREMLRERLPLCELRPSRVEGLVVESLMGLDDEAFYIEGWLCDGESSVVRMTAVSPEGSRTELLDGVFRYPRPDADEFFKGAIGEIAGAKYGFITLFRPDTPSLLPNGWVVEVETASGSAVEAPAPVVVRDYKRVRTELLSDLENDSDDRTLLRGHISPALSALQTRRDRGLRTERAVQFGHAPEHPSVSIVVPLYGRIDLLEHQLAQFADDPDLHDAELIYILDSPELRSELLTLAEGLHRLYRIPFQVIVLSENGGYSNANNFGAAHARGELLLLLNSDVIPARHGWLTRLSAFYRSLDRPGAVGPKLLYEDDSLQHAGLYFAETWDRGTWMNEHYFKGLASDLPAANIARRVPAVTGACLMIDAELYRSIGGLSGKYIQGDYEDSDLCLRLWSGGFENWYCPEVALYHLEGQSYPSAARVANTRYNRWLFNEMWSDAIARVMRESTQSAEQPPQRRNGVRPARQARQSRMKEVSVP